MAKQLNRKNNCARESLVGRQIVFHWFEPDDSIDLNVPEDVVAIKGLARDGGCYLKFSVKESHTGGRKERFSFYLYPRQIEQITLAIWRAYFKTQPQYSYNHFQEVLRKLKLFLKGKRLKCSKCAQTLQRSAP